jgi:hypothetical protein
MSVRDIGKGKEGNDSDASGDDSDDNGSSSDEGEGGDGGEGGEGKSSSKCKRGRKRQLIRDGEGVAEWSEANIQRLQQSLGSYGYGAWEEIRRDAKLREWPLRDIARGCRLALLQVKIYCIIVVLTSFPFEMYRHLTQTSPSFFPVCLLYVHR